MIKPMLATLVDRAFDSEEWIFEIKWDGYRALAFKKEKVELISRNELSFNKRFPQIVKELEKIKGPFVLDGEIVILNKKNQSQFQFLQNYKSDSDARLCYYIFDILFYQGKDLRNLPLLDRKKILKTLLSQYKFQHLYLSEHIETKGKAFFTQAKKKGLEGIIAKKKDSLYSSARSKNWLKIKNKKRQEFVIGGFTAPQKGRKYFGSLLIGYYEKKDLIYAGHVGTGFNEVLLRSTYQQMVKMIRKKSPFKNEPAPNAPVTWIQPKLVCEVSFAEWTDDGSLRHPVFHGLRTDKSPLSIWKEKAKK